MCLKTGLSLCIYIYIYIYVCVCVCVSVCVCMYAWYDYVHVCVHNVCASVCALDLAFNFAIKEGRLAAGPDRAHEHEGGDPVVGRRLRNVVLVVQMCVLCVCVCVCVRACDVCARERWRRDVSLRASRWCKCVCL